MNIFAAIMIAVVLLVSLPFLGALMPFILEMVGSLFNALYSENPVAAVMSVAIPFVIILVFLVRTFWIGQAEGGY